MSIVKNRKFMEKGLVLVEVLIASGILALLLVPILSFFVTSLESNWFASKEIKAQSLLLEQLEAVRSIRERNWPELKDGTYYLQLEEGSWKLVENQNGETVGSFTRKIEILPVYRSINDLIVEAAEPGSRLDPSTKKITATVSWHVLRDRSISVSTYLTRHLDNLIWKQTTQAEFDLGEKQYVETTQVVDGEVQLEGGCGENPAGAWIYNESFQNTWQIHPSAQNNIREITQPPGYVYEGTKALELSSFSGADTKLRNVGSVCTLGFTRFDFYAYNSASIEQSFQIGGDWQGGFVEVVLPSNSWQFFSIAYNKISGDNENNLSFLFFKPGNALPETKFYLDNMTLSGGVGGYYSEGTLISLILDGNRETVFNQISYTANLPAQTEIGFQIATSNSSEGPWFFYGPGGATETNDLYTQAEGEGIWLGNNFGRFLRYKAYLRSLDGTGTPVLSDVTINYSP
ncbi:MAG TPA: hypothetical protein VMW41_01955 [Candidatus Bathyarchaeia archaeon]|nr:hypothetical protein [Candidatus Bathyarchaeia archaeon]